MDQQAFLPPSMDLWTIFFLLAAGQGLFLCIMLFLNPKGHRRSNRLLGLFIGLFALTLFEYFLHWTKLIQQLPHFLTLYMPIIFLFGPLLFFYFRTLKPDFRFKWWDLAHLLPFLLFTLNRLPFYLSPGPAKAGYVREGLVTGLTAPYVNVLSYHAWFFVGHLSLYVVAILWILQKEGFLNQPEGPGKVQQAIRRRWSLTLFYLYTGFVLSNISYYVLVRTTFFSDSWDYGISLAMMLFVYIVGYLGFKQPEIFSGQLMTQLFQPSKYEHSSLTESASQSLLRRLVDYMDQEQPFLNNDLRLDNLAEELHCSRHHLSQVINQQIGKSFSEFVNDYRVTEVRELLEDPTNRQRYIIELAYSAGFNNKTSFNKAFKLRTGLSPSQYRRQHFASSTPKRSF